MFIVTYRKFFYAFSSLLVIICLGSVAVWGLNLGIDFKGGSTLQVNYPVQSFPDQATVLNQAVTIDPHASVRPSGNDGYIVSMRSLSQSEKINLENTLGITSFATSTATTSEATASSTAAIAATTISAITETQFDSVGPVLGAEAARKAIVSIILVIIAIVLFIAYAFRKVSQPVSSWKYGLTAIIALMHDVIIPTGVFAILGHFAGYQIDTLFVTALLVVLGFSVHDTIVVFDRVRENLHHAAARKPFDQIVGESIRQTFTRSINTSLTTLLALVVLYIVGGASIQHFALALIVGIAAGTYSSVFIGSPLLVTFEKMQAKKLAAGKSGGKK